MIEEAFQNLEVALHHAASSIHMLNLSLLSLTNRVKWENISLHNFLTEVCAVPFLCHKQKCIGTERTIQLKLIIFQSLDDFFIVELKMKKSPGWFCLFSFQ